MINERLSQSGEIVSPYRRAADQLPISRRAMIMNTGLAALSVAGLSSCTNYGAPSAEAPAAALTVKKADIPVGSGTVFKDAEVVITQPKQDEFKAFTAICTHQQCTVANVTNTINCDCHGSKYSISDGSVVHDPAPEPLAAKTVTVEGDSITVT